MLTRFKNSKSILFGFLFVLALAAAAWCADPPGAHGALWVPFAPGCAVSVADDLPGVSMALAWTGDGYEKADTLQPGYGYFLIPGDPDADLQLPDCRLDLLGAQSVSITLHAGWNLLGNPFNESLTFNAVADASGVRAQAFAARAVARSARAIISQGGQAGPGEVAWVYALQQGSFPLAAVADAVEVKKIQLIPSRASGDTSNIFYIPGSVTFFVSVAYDDGGSETLDPARVQWSISDENVGRFDEPGVLTSVAPGAVKVTASLANGMSASVDVQLVVECEKVCISAVVPPSQFQSTTAYEQFADNLRTSHMGIMPMPASDCAYMQVFTVHNIKPVKQAALSLVEGVSTSNPNVRAYCRQNFDSGGATYVLFETDPLSGEDRKVWLKDITAQTEWSWDKQDVIAAVSGDGVIQTAARGYSDLTASYKGMHSSPAFVGVDQDKPVSITAHRSREAAGSSTAPPEPWATLTCRQLHAGICRQGESGDTRLSVLPLGRSAPLFARVAYLSGRYDDAPAGVTWSTDPEGVATVSEGGTVSAQGIGRAAVRARLGELVSDPLDVAVDRESVNTLFASAVVSQGNAGAPAQILPVSQNAVIQVYNFSKLAFEISASTTWGRSVSLQPGDVDWTVTDAAGNTVNAMDFSGGAPFAVTVSYESASLAFTLKHQDLSPTLRVYTIDKSVDGYVAPQYAKNILLEPEEGVIHVAQPELLLFAMESMDSFGRVVDFTDASQWSMAGPDGAVTQGTPHLKAPGLYTVTAVHKGKSQSVKINVFLPEILSFNLRRTGGLSEVDSKFKAGETFQIRVLECATADSLTRGKPVRTSVSGYWEGQYVTCGYYFRSDIDARYKIQTTDPQVLVYDGDGYMRAVSSGSASVRAVYGERRTNELTFEVWESVDNFPTCGKEANQVVWNDPNKNYSFADNVGVPRSRAILQTDCNTYKPGEKVKVRWSGQIDFATNRVNVNACVDLYIKDSKGNPVKVLRHENCVRTPARSASDARHFTTMFDTMEEWDQTDAEGNRVASGRYTATSSSQLLTRGYGNDFTPVMEVEFTIE